jgi:hypothetical protein
LKNFAIAIGSALAAAALIFASPAAAATGGGHAGPSHPGGLGSASGIFGGHSVQTGNPSNAQGVDRISAPSPTNGMVLKEQEWAIVSDALQVQNDAYMLQGQGIFN